MRIDLRTGVVDLRGVPDAQRYGGGEYSRVLHEALYGGWGYFVASAQQPGVVAVARLEVQDAHS